MKPDQPPTMLPDEVQRRSSLVLRTLPILLIPFGVAIAVATILRFTLADQLAALERPDEQGFPLIPVVVIIIFFTSLIMLVRLGKPTVSALVLIGGWTLFTTVAALQNGVTSLWPALLIMPICAAGLLLDGAASVSLAALATLLVGSMAWLESRGLLPDREPLPAIISSIAPLLGVAFWMMMFWTIAALTSLLAGNLQRALQQSRAQAQDLAALSQELEARVAAQTAELATRAARAEALYEVTRALTSTLDLPEVLALIAEQAAQLLRFRSSQVLLDQPERGGFTLVGSYNLGAGSWSGPFDDDAEEALRQALEGRQPMALALAGTGALVLPMHHTNQVAGLLVLLDPRESVPPGPDELALAAQLADQAAVAVANAQLLARSRESATVEERARLAREIHDTLAQGLTGIIVQIGAAQRALSAAPEEAGRHLDLGQRMARESLAEARASVWNLRAPALSHGELIAAIQRLAAHPVRPDLLVIVEQTGALRRLPASVETALLRVCQEALTNVAKHSAATQATICLDYGPEAVRLTISDNGPGFDQYVLEHGGGAGLALGFGLQGMRERLGSLGGALTLRTSAGAQVEATVPYAQEQPAGAPAREHA